MIASLDKALSTFLVALLLSLSGPALAQEDAGAPVRLPGADGVETEDTTADAPQPVPSRPGARDLGIEVGVISSRAPTVGTLSGTDGLGGEIWEGTSSTSAQILINQIPVGAPSRAMNALTRRLLLTASRPPHDPRGGDPIIELRIERALEAGFIDAVPTMISQATQLQGDPEIEILRAETILLRGGGMEACTNATSMRFESEEPFWMKLRAYCFAHQGLVPTARLTADLLYDIGDEDELFQLLLERLMGNESVNLRRALDTPLSPMHLTMMREMGMVPPASPMETQSLSVMRVMAIDPAWSGDEGLAFRLSTAETAARAGAFSATELLAVYGDVSPFVPERRTEQLSAGARSDTAASRALFAEALTVDTIPGTRAETLSAGLSIAAHGEMGLFYAAVLGRASRNLLPEEVLAWVSYDMALSALADGNLASAYDWFDIFSAGSETSPSKVQALRAAITMAAPSERYSFWPEHALRWLASADLGDLPHTRLAAQLMWFDAMGYAVPEEVKERLRFYENELRGVAPPVAVIGNLRAAADAGRIGETVANALVVIGPNGPAAAHPAALAEAIRALREVGLDTDARALATEALIAIALEDVE